MSTIWDSLLDFTLLNVHITNESQIVLIARTYDRGMINAVVFDMGMVLSSPPDPYTETAARLGVEPTALEARYWTGRDAYDHGGTVADYWGALTRDLGVETSPENLDELAQFDMSLWTRLRPDAQRILADVRGSVGTVAILSNSPHALVEAADQAPWRTLVDHVFVSAPLGLMKPDPAIYQLVSDSLGLVPETIAFIDDKQANVDGALAAGWQAHLWVDDADTRGWLESIGAL